IHSNNSSIAKPPFSFYHTRKRGFVHNLFTHAFVLIEQKAAVAISAFFYYNRTSGSAPVQAL
ncbi:MAG: hypothetical protein KH441_05045, partial [Clostridium sp.]|nr:hypothetical protein [Clostridium sp.]